MASVVKAASMPVEDCLGGTPASLPPGLHELVELQTARTPEAVAVAFEGRQLTYAELGRCADRLADRLQMSGVGLEVLVAISAERSLELVVGLLAILKAGGAYV